MALASRITELFRFDVRYLRSIESQFIDPKIRRRKDVAARREKLATIIADDIIPHLMRLHAEAPIADIIDAPCPDADDVAELARIVLGSDLAAPAAYVAALRERGMSRDTLYLELLEPTAQLLGEKWSRDECDFIDVTLGVARLQKLLALFNPDHDIADISDKRWILMATAPGEQHQFGVRLMQDVFAASRWNVDCDYSATIESLGQAVHDQWYAMVGLTLSTGEGIGRLKTAIETVRRQLRNPGILIMVGGEAFRDKPWLAQQIGADATAPNATAAALLAHKLFDDAVAKRWRAVPAE